VSAVPPGTSAYPLRRLREIADFVSARRAKGVEDRRGQSAGPRADDAATGPPADAFASDQSLVSLTGAVSPPDMRVDGVARSPAVRQPVIMLRPRAGIDGEYLRLALTQCLAAPVVAAPRALNRKSAAELVVPVPGLGEQRKIAAILAGAEALRTKRIGMSAGLDAFLRMLFLERFGDPATNPRRWPCLPLAALGENQDALRTKGRAAGRSEGSFPLHSAHGIGGRSETAAFRGERLLIAASGANLVNRMLPVARVVSGAFSADQQVHVLASNGRAQLAYLVFAIELTELKPHLSAVHAPRLPRARLERLTVPVPPMDLQRSFCAVVAKVEQLRGLLQKSSLRIDELAVALRQRAFAGALPMQ
jgi:hypothetical protein